MIAAVRVRFTPTPASAVWSDATFANWLNPATPFSLANFWLKSSFGIADLKFQIFPPIVMDDPRLALSAADQSTNAKTRPALVNGAIAKITDSFHPDWSQIDGLLLWYAQQTDLFGGGSYPVPLPLDGGGPLDFIFGGPTQKYKNIPVSVSDIMSTFDSVCQELGHAYGFDHPLDRAGAEYGDPYDSMASQTYGGKYSSSFLRPVDPGLPVGVSAAGQDVQRLIGPYISAAHLYISPFASALKADGMFIDVPPSYASGASSFTLHALDDAIERYPAQKLQIAAVIPPLTAGGDTYFLELRRNVGYDGGLHIDDADPASPPHPPIAVVIHYYDKARGRIVFFDKFPLADNRGDRDYHSFGGGGFTFRVTSIGPDFRSVGITIGGAEFWRNFGVNIDDVETAVLSTRRTLWQFAQVSPCFLFPPGEYRYSLEYTTNQCTLIVSSFGCELPVYIWTLNGITLDPAKKLVDITTYVQTPGPAGTTTAMLTVAINYTVGTDRLTLTCDPTVGNFSLYVEVKSVETSPGVLKNLYEDKTQVTSISFDNVSIAWDGAYTSAQKECAAALDAVAKKHIAVQRARVPQPGDPARIRVIESLINEVTTTAVNTGVSVAEAIVGEIARVATAVREQIAKGRQL